MRHPSDGSSDRVEQILTALRATQAPGGLEQRISARLRQASAERHATSNALCIWQATAHSRLAFAAACVVLLALVSSTLHYRASTPIPLSSSAAQPSVAQLGVSARTSNLGERSIGAALPAPRVALTRLRRPADVAAVGVPTPDAIARAETLAPSRPAPDMSLSEQPQSQEALLLPVARPDSSIHVVVFEQSNAPALRAMAQARLDAEIRRYVRSMLAPIALADALSSTEFSEPREISTLAPLPHPPASLAN
ncbi:MAG: hypothetical protein ACP5E5_02025 [Acidobacteriaceae bacterium]